jgi:hypothetical protein
MLLVAERNGPTMLARIGMMRAINRLETKPTQATRQRRAKAYGSCVRPGSMRAAFFLTNPDCCHQSTAPPLDSLYMLSRQLRPHH